MASVTEKKILVATWEYLDADGLRRRAFFGDIVRLTDAEVDRAQAAGVFAAAVAHEGPAPAGDDGAASGEGGTEAPQDPGAQAGGERPKKAASKATWVAYAVSRGMDEAEAKAMNRDDLVQKFSE
ncbi:Uncharacterised protein [Mycobacteroides abscessus subsp. bolletii]|uniref:hypothetical protein n=1 Tax=Mycobacteroides abscessus TaxID=36809 RepID=UPI0009287C83|nr:hypothetical protein [Mycobacteroides abscessus]SIJ52384.1 Uncharacterised protein [Mycobacteroides abscessus subsp. bolletii]SLD45471.1 Uncharacterised protein [Mycobacteroides abscessus subsp. bolletii]SLE36296.1 Uncharacterised protein [Mycobacteroides abscessus subsp. bolletii]